MSFDESVIMTNHAKCLQADCPKLWVFGYGSLLWNPGFEYNSRKTGYIENYRRAFNQGNETFRGTREKPGRVANLEEKKGSKVWGVSYEICGREAVFNVLRNLYIREIACGGYEVMMTAFYPREDKSRGENQIRPASSSIQVLLFTPTQENSLYLGSDTMSKMVRQIVEAKGTAGSNIEYVLRISDYIQKYIPEDNDSFLFDLDAKIREELLRVNGMELNNTHQQDSNTSIRVMC